MSIQMKNLRVIPIAAGFMLLQACAGQQTKPDELQSLESQLKSFQSNPTTVRTAAVQLDELEKLTERAQSSWNDGDDREYEHVLFLAQKQADVTRARTEIGEKRQEVNSLAEQRNQLRLDAQEARLTSARADLKTTQSRAQEAEEARKKAQQEAQAAREEVEQARLEAQLAADQAMALSAELENVKAEQTDRGTLLTLQDILFEFGKSELKDGAERTMQKLAEFINKNPKVNLVIEGFTDSIGSEEFNLKLSEERANAVRDAMLENGVEASRMTTKGMGEQFPVASNDTDPGRSKNRRVEILLEQ